MTASDLHDREVLIEQQRERITVLEVALREQASPGQLLVARDALLLDMRAQLLGVQQEQNRNIAALGGQVTNLATQLADANKQLCHRLDNLMKDAWAIRGDMETQQLWLGGEPFVNRLCDELLRVATVLRAPEMEPLPVRIHGP
jgi:small-conductance mechanosensitive channel